MVEIQMATNPRCHFVQLRDAAQFHRPRSERTVLQGFYSARGESSLDDCRQACRAQLEVSRVSDGWMTMRWRMLAICSTENRQLVKSAILEWSLEVCWCSTLQEARRSLQRGNHALVLCEAELPDGTYQDVLRLLKDKLDQIRVIVLAESHWEDCYRQAIEMGAFDVISAPHGRTDVQWIILQALQGHPAATSGSRKGGRRRGQSSLAVA